MTASGGDPKPPNPPIMTLRVPPHRSRAPYNTPIEPHRRPSDMRVSPCVYPPPSRRGWTTARMTTRLRMTSTSPDSSMSVRRTEAPGRGARARWDDVTSHDSMCVSPDRDFGESRSIARASRATSAAGLDVRGAKGLLGAMTSRRHTSTSSTRVRRAARKRWDGDGVTRRERSRARRGRRCRRRAGRRRRVRRR